MAAAPPFLESGVAYYLLDTQDIQLFADRTVYLAVYQGFVPSYKEFSVAEDGSITMREDVVGCMFTLPLDASQSDPEAARALVEAAGLPTEPMTDKELAALEQEAPKVAEVETPGGIELVEVPGHGHRYRHAGPGRRGIRGLHGTGIEASGGGGGKRDPL